MKFLRVIAFTFLAVLNLLAGPYIAYSEAQQSKAPGPSLAEDQLKGACRKDPSITFSEEQVRELESLQRAYLEEIRPLWNELGNLRRELRFAISDPQVQSQALLDKQRKASAIQAKIENLRFSYLIKTRSILAKEQLERMPRDCPLKMGGGYRTTQRPQGWIRW
jgi:hypothetical protein